MRKGQKTLVFYCVYDIWLTAFCPVGYISAIRNSSLNRDDVSLFNSFIFLLGGFLAPLLDDALPYQEFYLCIDSWRLFYKSARRFSLCFYLEGLDALIPVTARTIFISSPAFLLLLLMQSPSHVGEGIVVAHHSISSAPIHSAMAKTATGEIAAQFRVNSFFFFVYFFVLLIKRRSRTHCGIRKEAHPYSNNCVCVTGKTLAALGEREENVIRRHAQFVRLFFVNGGGQANEESKLLINLTKRYFTLVRSFIGCDIAGQII